MDKERLLRLNDILRQAYEAGNLIDDLDGISTWFMGTPEQIAESVKEVTDLFDEAHNCGMLNRWSDIRDHRGHCTFWDWTTMAHTRAKQLNIVLADPLGNSPLFANVSNRITTPIEMIRPMNTDKLDNDLCGHLNQVYEEQVRYVVSHKGKPVAAVVPLVDLEMLKQVQLQTDPIAWLEWVQQIRGQLCWPPVTFDDKEE